MKKIIALLLCLALLSVAFVSCSSEGTSKENKKGNAKVGDTLKAPEKTADFDDFKKLTLYTNFNVGGVDKQNQVCSYYNDGGTAIYYYNINHPQDNFSIEYYTVVEDGKATSYNNSWFEFQPVDSLSDTMSDEEWHKTNLAYVGVNPESDKTIIEYVKCEDDEFNGKDCYVYTVKYEEDPEAVESVSDSTVWVDKKTGLWLKSLFTIDGVEVIKTTEFEEKAVDIPGTIPVSIEKTDVYNTLNFRLTAKSLDTTNPSSAGIITFEAENKSGEAIRIYTNSFAVNGLTLAQKAFDETVEAGATVEFDCSISESSTSLSGIEIIKEISMNLHLETADGTVIEEGIEAEKINTNAPFTYVQEINTAGTEILNENGVRVVFQSFDFNKSGDPLFKAWIENDFTQPVRITINLNKINGEEYGDFEKLYMPASSQGYSAFYLNDSEITELNSIEITAEAFSGALFNSDRVTEETEPVTIELN